jgi:hypothetical protein
MLQKLSLQDQMKQESPELGIYASEVVIARPDEAGNPFSLRG